MLHVLGWVAMVPPFLGAIYLVALILKYGFTGVKRVFTSRRSSVRVTFLIACLFLAFHLLFSGKIAAALTPHELHSNDMIVRYQVDPETKQRIPVAWYNELHELHVYYLDDKTLWWKDLNGKWHKVTGMDSSNIVVLMFMGYVIITAGVYVVLYRREKRIHNKVQLDS